LGTVGTLLAELLGGGFPTGRPTQDGLTPSYLPRSGTRLCGLRLPLTTEAGTNLGMDTIGAPPPKAQKL
jgi:hypothetical protein